jgi:ornithine cyclodeaminase/alanine dehydrogenase-like protein (mu-crystallin family)
VDDQQITVFDSSGFALQDLAFAEAILAADEQRD